MFVNTTIQRLNCQLTLYFFQEISKTKCIQIQEQDYCVHHHQHLYYMYRQMPWVNHKNTIRVTSQSGVSSSKPVKFLHDFFTLHHTPCIVITVHRDTLSSPLCRICIFLDPCNKQRFFLSVIHKFNLESHNKFRILCIWPNKQILNLFKLQAYLIICISKIHHIFCNFTSIPLLFCCQAPRKALSQTLWSTTLCYIFN